MATRSNMNFQQMKLGTSVIHHFHVILTGQSISVYMLKVKSPPELKNKPVVSEFDQKKMISLIHYWPKAWSTSKNNYIYNLYNINCRSVKKATALRFRYAEKKTIMSICYYKLKTGNINAEVWIIFSEYEHNDFTNSAHKTQSLIRK